MSKKGADNFLIEEYEMPNNINAADGTVDPEQLQILANSGNLERLNNYIYKNSKKTDFNNELTW